MTKKDWVMKVLEDMGLRPSLDADGDIAVRYQLKTIYVLTGDENEPFLVLMMPRFYEIKEGEEHVALAVSNRMTRDLKLIKVYVEKNYKEVSANCEFCYTDEESLKRNIEYSLKIFGVIRTMYRTVRAEMMEKVD